MKIFCVGRNYAEHAKELGNDVPDEPVIFMKPKSAYLTNKMPFYYPHFSNELHYEAEIVLRVCKNGKHIPQKHALKYVNQLTVGIDFTARDIQQNLKASGLPWEKAKSWDGSAYVGTWRDCNEKMWNENIEFSLYKNDQKVQHGHTKQMIFKPDYLIAHLSSYFSLNIGDLIFTGTPAGVGECLVGDCLEGFLWNEKLLHVDIK